MTLLGTRRERVILDLEDRFSAPIARAAAATSMFSKNVDRMGSSTRKTGPDIDRFSGRVKLLADTALILGPALVPLGAATLPLLTAAFAGLGAAAGGIGVTVLAMKGLGDAVKALDAYQLEPTAANLQKLRIEQEKLGPAGAEFLAYLDQIEPQLKSLQLTAREGLLPGVEQGIDNLLTRLPQVRKIVRELSEGMGDLARDAGDSLASERWDPFFSYVENEARPTLDAFAKSTGNVVLGVANLLVAFAPLTRDVTGGLEEMTARFAEWSEGLARNEGFQEFLAYVEQSGPQALDFIGEIASMLGAVAQAAAPIGSAVLPVLTALAKVVGTIAGSPLGSAFLTAMVALRAYTRVAAVATATTTRLGAAVRGLGGRKVAGGLGLLAASLTDVDDKAGLTNTAMLGTAGLLAGPWGAAVGTGIGLTLDLSQANDNLEASISRANAAMRSGDRSAMRAELESLERQVRAVDEALNIDTGLEQLGLISPVANLASGGIGRLRAGWQKLSGAQDAARGTIKEVQGAMRQGGDIADLFGRDIGRTGTEIRRAAAGASLLSQALAELNGWLDKRQALLNYNEALRGLREGFKDGFGPDDAQGVIDMGRAIAQVFRSIKSKELKQDFLADAIAGLDKLADTAGPKAEAATRALIRQLRELDTTKAEPKVDPDTKPAIDKVDRVKGDLKMVGATTARPKVELDAGNAFTQIYNLKGALRNIPRFIPVQIHVSRTGTDAGVPFVSGGGKPTAGGGTVPKSGLPYADRYLYLLADGEEVISNRHGQADRHRQLLKAINDNRMAVGGTAGGQRFSATYAPGAIAGGQHFSAVATSAAGALAVFRDRLQRAQKALEAETAQRDELRSKADEVSSGIRGGLAGSIWEGPSNVWAAGSRYDPIGKLNAQRDRARRFAAAIIALRGKGLTGAALAEILGEGLEAAEYMAAQPLEMTGAYATAYAEREAAIGQAAALGGQLTYGAAADAMTPHLKDLTATVKRLEALIERKSDEHKGEGRKNAQEAGKAFGHEINNAARGGKRRAHS